MGLKSYLKRGLQYVINGVPIAHTSVQVAKIANNELLKGRTALITGGTSGIGYSIAEAFLESGANVVITGRNQVRINKALDELRRTHLTGKIGGIVLNNSNIADTTTTLESFLKDNDVDLLVNNAGINGGALNTCSEEEFQSIMDTNLKGAVFITRLITNDMIRKGKKGNVLNICSSSSNRPANTADVLSKWGMKAYTLGLAKSLIKHGIVVNGLAPGPTATPMLGKESTNNITLPNNPSGRFAMPEEIANMAVILTSNMGKMIVGDII